jgi:hypothetical protein
MLKTRRGREDKMKMIPKMRDENPNQNEEMADLDSKGRCR